MDFYGTTITHVAYGDYAVTEYGYHDYTAIHPVKARRTKDLLLDGAEGCVYQANYLPSRLSRDPSHTTCFL